MSQLEWQTEQQDWGCTSDVRSDRYDLHVASGTAVRIEIRNGTEDRCVASAYLETDDIEAGKRVAETMLEILLRQEER